MIIPTIFETSKSGYRTACDIYSKLLKERVIFLTGEINESSASSVIAQLLYLEAEDPNRDIKLYITSGGGEISSGMGIYDTMRLLKCDVSTICVGHCCSMASFLLAGGKKGKRFILPNGEVMIHQPSGGICGQASDISIVSDHILKLRKRLNTIMAENTGKKLSQIEKDSERDNWMSAEEALQYGLVDRILSE